MRSMDSNNCHHVHDVQQLTMDEVAKRLLAAQQQCSSHGVRFTPLRQQIYELILQADQPIGAYDLITQLQQMRLAESDESLPDKEGDHSKSSLPKNVAPPTVYRSLEFLLKENLIHQLTSMNAYVPCCHPRADHTAAFLICERCQRVQECSSIPVQEIMTFAKKDVGFCVTRSVIELSGYCRDCAIDAPS